MILPGLGLLMDCPVPSSLATLVADLARWSRPFVVESGTGRPAAWIASSPLVAGLAKAARDGSPMAIWVDNESQVQSARQIAAVLVTDRRHLAGAGAVVVPEAGLDADAIPTLPPFVRARWRARLGLPAEMVVGVGVGEGGLGDHVIPSALALASAVAVSGSRLVEAMAWGAPCACDSRSAAAALAGNGEVVIGEPDELMNLAGHLAGDERRTASLSRAGRLLVESVHDRRRPAEQVAVALGLVGQGPMQRLRANLADLGTPVRSRVRDRVELAFAGLGEEGGS